MLCLRGDLVIVGKQPDGDSIRFACETPALLDRLERSGRVRVSSDGSVQLRLDGIDAPETHYEGHAQPLGDAARDRLLALSGFTHVTHGTGTQAQTVTAAEPARIAGAILAHTVDPNGRPVSFVLAGGELPPDGADVDVADLLARTLNAGLLGDGSAYLALYESLDAAQRDALHAVAAEAAGRAAGVWGADASHGFDLAGQSAIGPAGALIVPKLFRRCTDYLATRAPGETLAHWMRTHGTAARPEDDLVSVAGAPPVPLSTLIEQSGDHISLTASPLDLVFSEK